MDLRITSTPALIGINTIPWKVEIQQPKADVELNTQHPKVEIHSEQVQVQIDQSKCFSEAGLKPISELSKENADLGHQKVMEGIARRVRQGHELAAIHKGGNPIASHAAENAFHLDDKEFTFDLIPKSRPKIDFIGGTVDINVIEGKVDMEVQVNKPIIDFTRGKVEIYLRQRNSIQIEYVGNSLNVTA
ncbi:hypothetical protein HNQ80_002514 [Anaerosolibacter carboniphilus]|uniref:Uncharacterized protein n=1 Tax=Anaerosolibacter carboniphilus TaxID=1417629 RepID=A0A841KRP2_9FIRM|nr:DUF6470 family protein [Anaerosolibacter carboniphilus]MBB6216414.1 hypothetical protein [Anaerosolibacter carboniphilus]